jgi:hypothetical protein
LRSDNGHCELPLRVRFDPFGAPFGKGRYLRIPAIAAPSSDDKIHFRDRS